ncbi:hypothetical protein BDZ94DRAFT_1233035 [Collybia nuda]|uniref:Protein-S-isoprenylcysteine O-methyltransferase n=1 Tax=Collybia nuda TaxID=64659 RepID=A0A9P6CIS2_9AGAR|nr:hypothetical protein BDZ94DRAFT_1233035 [Collybia nuda]
MSSLWKIPFILVSIVGAHVTLTSPAPPPLEHESRAKTEGSVRVTHAVPITKYFLWVLSIAEIVTIIAYHTAWFPYSQIVLSFLMPRENASAIHLTQLFICSAIVCVCGSLLRYQCYRTMGQQFTFELSIREGHTLVTSGPYGIVRHPGYTGIFVALIGAACLHGSRGSWLRESGVLGTEIGRVLVGSTTMITCTALGSLRWRMRNEDKALRDEFGDAWWNWADAVPYALIPGIY